MKNLLAFTAQGEDLKAISLVDDWDYNDEAAYDCVRDKAGETG